MSPLGVTMERKEFSVRLKLFLACVTAFALAANAAYDLFKEGYPPSGSAVNIVGDSLEISLSSCSVGESLSSELDSRFRVTEASDALAVPFSSQPVAFCITIR